MKKLAGGGARAALDKRADVRSSRGDDPIKRGNNPFVFLHLLQAVNVGFTGDVGGLLHTEVAFYLVGFLQGNDLARNELLPPCIGDLGEFQIRLGGEQIRLGLMQLLVEFRDFDLCEQISGPDVRTDVDVPFFEIPIRMGIDRRVAEGLGISGQGDFRDATAGLW